MTPKAIIFDFDGTLVTGTNAGYVRCYHQAALALGSDIPFEVAERRVLEQWGKAPRIELESVLRESPGLVDRAVIVYEELLETELFSIDVMPVSGARQALTEVRQMGIAALVVSGMPYKLLQRFAGAYEFGFAESELISTIDTDDPLKQKSTGYHLRLIMNSRGWRAEDVLVVGDAQSDIAMAHSQRVRAIAVLTGFLKAEEALALGAYRVLGSVAELPSMEEFQTRGGGVGEFK